MKFLTLISVLSICFLAACSSTGSQNTRISQNQAQFNSFSPAEQRMIRAGQVAVGFDPDMVRMALGQPSHQFTNATMNGTSMVWEYDQMRPNLGGFVGATVGRGVNAGVGISGSPTRTKLLKRVTFGPNGKVSRYQSFN